MFRKKISLLLSFAFILCFSCSQKDTSKPESGKQVTQIAQKENWVGQKAPLFTLTEASTSEEINLSDLIGKKIIYITWWATWCKACIEEIPELKQIYSKFKDKGLEIIAINVKESQRKVAKYVKKKEVPYLNILDLDGAVSKIYKIVGIPINVIIDSKGVIKYYGSKIPANAEEMIASLTAELEAVNSEKENSEEEKNSQTAAKYKKAPDFALKGIDGITVNISSFKDKVVLLNFWATWCPPCRMEIPHLIEIQKELSSKGVQVVGISVDKISIKGVKKFAEKNKINYPVLMFNNKVVSDYNGTANISIPRTFIIDREGNIRDMFVGLRDKKFLVSKLSKLI